MQTKCEPSTKNMSFVMSVIIIMIVFRDSVFETDTRMFSKAYLKGSKGFWLKPELSIRAGVPQDKLSCEHEVFTFMQPWVSGQI